MLSRKKGLPYYLNGIPYYSMVNLAIDRKGLLKFDNDYLSDLFTSMIVNFQILYYTLVGQKKNERSDRPLFGGENWRRFSIRQRTSIHLNAVIV